MAEQVPTTKRQPAKSPEARVNQLVSLAYDLAERQLRDGTASSQVITEFLKAGSQKSKLELEMMHLEKDLIVAKTENMKSAKHMEDLYNKATSAMRSYQGVQTEDDLDE